MPKGGSTNRGGKKNLFSKGPTAIQKSSPVPKGRSGGDRSIKENLFVGGESLDKKGEENIGVVALKKKVLQGDLSREPMIPKKKKGSHKTAEKQKTPAKGLKTLEEKRWFKKPPPLSKKAFRRGEVDVNMRGGGFCQAHGRGGKDQSHQEKKKKQSCLSTLGRMLGGKKKGGGEFSEQKKKARAWFEKTSWGEEKERWSLS